MSDTLTRVTNVVVDYFGFRPEAVALQTSLFDDLGVDSLEMMELSAAFEQEFSIEISEEITRSLQIVGDIVSYIRSRRAGARD